MRRRGINYDTGFAPFGALSRPAFEPARIQREMGVIARDLHCNAVRISGRDPERIALAADYALREGLEVWFSPFPCNLEPGEVEAVFQESAERAERLRQMAPHVALVLGCELSLFNSGFIPGATFAERFQSLMDPTRLAALSLTPEELQRRFNAFLSQVVTATRQRFGGPVTYASGPWEDVDWSLFDIIGVDYYPDASNHGTYGEALRPYLQSQRPVVVTEFGCATFQGAGDRGAMGWAIVDRATQPPTLREPVERSEREQAETLLEALTALDRLGVDGAFWFTFASYTYPYHSDARYDLDRAAFGLVKMLDGQTGQTYPDMPWEPKQSFHALAHAYSAMAEAGRDSEARSSSCGASARLKPST